MKDEKTPPRGRLAVDMLRKIGTRLSSSERAPYEIPDHDDTVDLNDPTGDVLLPPAKKETT